MAIRDFLVALTGARNSIGTLDREIADLEGERARVAKLPPDTASFIAWLKKGLENHERAFIESLSWHWTPDTLSKLDGEWIDNDAEGGHLLGTKRHRAGNGEYVGQYRGLDISQPPADPAALVFFMRPLIEDRLPELVGRVWGSELRNGISAADRAKRLSRIDTDLIKLRKQREEILAELEAARAAAT
ncbi:MULTISPECIES: hypothetical protein [Ralstonia]|uniref:hypothetical protein n=1 Tax=Ralstonia TaxID=48736 RepID=UPI0003860EAB|nr:MULTISPECIES: hypothetical protein [Ralstonia]EPX97782.1 hypothetical protein C404_12085 [Ralstonia sp. AU12-08]